MVQPLNSEETHQVGMKIDCDCRWYPEFSLLGSGTFVNVFLGNSVHLSFFALGASHLLAPCYFSKCTDLTSPIRHLRREIRDLLFRAFRVFENSVRASMTFVGFRIEWTGKG